MADVTISYKGNEIATMSDSGVKTLLTSSAFCEDDITVAYTKPAAPTPTLQTKSATYTPYTSQQTATITYDVGYDGLDEVNVTVDAMPSGTAGTPTATKGTVSSNSVSVTPSVTNTTGYITGGTKNGTPVTVFASELVSGTKTISASGTTDVTNYASASVAAGSATTPATSITANPTISVSSGGLITASVSASKSVTPTVSAGYVSSGTAGTVSVSGSNTSQLTTKAAQTYTPTTTDQTIANGRYLTGVQTIKGDANLLAENIKKDVVLFGVTGTYEGGGASNVCQGTFTTVSSQNTAATFDTGYTGSGYPVALVIYVDGGPYDSNSEWYNTVARFAVGFYSMVKSETTTVPSYSTSGTENQGTVMMLYKSSSSISYSQANMFTNTNNSFSSSNANSGTVCVRFKNNNHIVSYYTYGISTGLPVSTKMVYIVVYSS